MVQRTIYIAGPMRGIEYFNFPAFDEARDELTGCGWSVISPADLDREAGFDPYKLKAEGYDWRDLNAIGFDLHHAVDRDVNALKKCDAIYMLRGWEDSTGARAERAIAEWLGCEVIYQGAGSPEDILEEALRITSTTRQAQYGSPDQDFKRTAGMWSALFSDLLREEASFEPFHIAQAMILLKMSRQLHQRKRDNWVDTAGYARCGQQCDEVAK